MPGEPTLPEPTSEPDRKLQHKPVDLRTDSQRLSDTQDRVQELLHKRADSWLTTEEEKELKDSVSDIPKTRERQEQAMGPEHGERIEATRSALAKIVRASQEYSRPFDRKVVNNVGVVDPRANGGRGDIVDKTVPVDTGMEGMRQIDIRTFVGSEDAPASYHMTIVYDPNQPDSYLLLSIESPAPVDNPYSLSGAAAAGVRVAHRRFQDLLYKQGASEVPLHEADYTYVFDYRTTSHDITYPATQEQVTQLLQILSDGVVVTDVKKHDSRTRLVAKVNEIAPELAELTAR